MHHFCATNVINVKYKSYDEYVYFKYLYMCMLMNLFPKCCITICSQFGRHVYVVLFLCCTYVVFFIYILMFVYIFVYMFVYEVPYLLPDDLGLHELG